MFNFHKPNRPIIKICLGKSAGDHLIHNDWNDWPENLPIPRVGDFVHQNQNLRAKVMWIDYDYFNNKIDIFAGLVQ